MSTPPAPAPGDLPLSVSPEGGADVESEADRERAARARRRMVEQQVRARGVRDPRVLSALGRVPRHRFVPPGLRARAYEDQPLAIGHGQTISQPFVVGFMTEALALDGSERVLEVGTGSGYQTAVLAALAREVCSIEIVEPLARRAAAILGELGVANVRLRVGDGSAGWPDAAPFDAVLVTAAPRTLPPALLDQLAPGGRLVAPEGGEEQELVLVEKRARGLVRRHLLGVRFVPMTGAAGDG